MRPIDRLLTIMAQLRDKEKGCPWDIEQDFASIAPHTIEEAYEVADAIARKDMHGLRDELGDLLLQVVFHSQMANEQKLFNFDEVATAICDKLEKRHPHVFGDAVITTAADQEKAWEDQKAKERKDASSGIAEDPLAGVSLALPSLTRALKLQKRAERVGFDWPNIDAVFEKLNEEIQELITVMAQKQAPKAIMEEVGDIIFSCVNLARKLGVDPEESVRLCNRKFESRFSYMRHMLDLEQRNLSSASLQELNDLWDQAKIAEKTPPANKF